MNEYVLVLIWLAFMGFLSMLLPVKKTVALDYDNDHEQQRYSLIFCIIVMIPLIYWATFRYQWFGDTNQYVRTYLSTPESFTGLRAYLETVGKDKGFAIFRILCRMVFHDDFRGFFFVIALIQGVCVMLGFRAISPHYMFSMFLFVLGCDYFAWMYNGIRQFLVASILFACAPLLIKKKYVPMILIIVLLYFIHGSDFIWLPFLFIAQGKPWNKKTVAFLLAIIAAVVFLEEFTDLLGGYMDNSQYAYEKKDLMQDDGTGWPRIMVYSVPALLSFPYRKKIAEYDSPIINISVNMSIATMGLYIISGFTSGIYIGRLPIYFSLFNYVLLPWEIKHLFAEGTRQIIIVMCFLLYAIFFYVQMHGVWGVL